MKKERKPYYNKKHIMISERDWEDIKGNRHLTKQSAQITSFLIIMRGRFVNGFPVVIKKFWYPAIAIYPFVFVRRDSVNAERLNHEMIHIRQQLEMLIVFAYVWYLVEFLWRFISYGFKLEKAYYFHSMEREARINQKNGNYLLNRKAYSFLKYIK